MDASLKSEPPKRTLNPPSANLESEVCTLVWLEMKAQGVLACNCSLPCCPPHQRFLSVAFGSVSQHVPRILCEVKVYNFKSPNTSRTAAYVWCVKLSAHRLWSVPTLLIYSLQLLLLRSGIYSSFWSHGTKSAAQHMKQERWRSLIK